MSGQAQISLAPLTTFGSHGWLAPNGYNGSTYAYLTTGDTERGIAYGNHHLYLASRNGGNFVRVLDAQTGQDLGALNMGTALVSGGTYAINMVAVAEDGFIYVCNLAIAPDTFRIYRWTNDDFATLPTLVYNGVPLAGGRAGDSFAAIGSGKTTRLAAGFNSAPNVSGNNGYAIIDPSAGTATAVNFSSTPPAAGGFRLGICFFDATHVIGSQGGSGNPVYYSNFANSNGTLLASLALESTDERLMSFATVGGFPLLATLNTSDNYVRLYDMSDPTQPKFVTEATTASGTLAADAHNSGAVAWGSMVGNTATLYAMASDDGIQAFTVKVPAPTPPQFTLQPQSQAVIELSPVTFSAAASGIPAPTYQWYQGNQPIDGATNATFTLNAAQLGDNGMQFKVVAQNRIDTILNVATSSVVSLTVLADTNPPVLLTVQAFDEDQIQAVFSERINADTATNLANYTVTGTNGDITLMSAALDASQSNAVLQVSGLVEGDTYTLTVSNLKDQSGAGNVIAPASQVRFIRESYTPTAIGNPDQAGTQIRVPGGYDIAGTGWDIGGAADQCNFSYQRRTGDFDVALRLAGLSLSDVWAKAGLMARETLDSGSRFAAAVATPSMVGSSFTWRDTANGSSSTSGNFPVNYPNTWLRLKRAGNTFSGFGSYDGKTWAPLANATIAMPAQVYLGLAASSHSTNQPMRAQFRDLVEVTNAVISAVTNPNEPLGPCSRRTQLVISEIMYRPAPRFDGLDLAYVEIYNSNPWWDDISGYRIDGAIQYAFPTNTIIQGGAFIVIAAKPADLRQIYGITNVFGPYSSSLNKSGTVRLINNIGGILLEVPYSHTLPWPAGADGTGHSIVMSRPSYGEGDPRAWALSSQVGGSPGQAESFQPSPFQNVFINEFLIHPGSNQLAYIELYNHSTNEVDLSGCLLVDATKTTQFVLPSNSVIAASGFLSFDEAQSGLQPSPVGGLILLKSPDGQSIVDAVSYESQALNVSFGRWPDGGEDFYPLAARTPGAANGNILIVDIVINEIMYKPISGNDDDQYVELYNQGAAQVDLFGWSFTAGIDFVFANHTVIEPGGYLVVARNATRLLAHYPNLNAANTVGNYTGKLPHKGGRLALARPEINLSNDAGALKTNTLAVVEDEVSFKTGGRWGQWAHGGGSSLELINPKTNHRLAYNWADSIETGKSVWTNLQFTGLLDNGANYSGSRVDLVQAGLLDVGECLLDNIAVFVGTNGANMLLNGDFEAGSQGWTMQGDHSRSSIETAAGLGGYQSAQSLHVRSSDGIWTGANSAQGTLTNTSLASGQTATLKLAGRWLHGSPEVLLRLRGNWLELSGSLPVPGNLGTPGGPNSQAVSHAGPAIFNVKHSPAIPPANRPVVVTACFHDFTHFQPSLLYRIDTGINPAPTYQSINMVDDGSGNDEVAGDGIYTATIPAQSAGKVIAFLVRGHDDLGAEMTFPSDIKDNSGYPRECVVCIGDTVPRASFGQYHLWLTQNWINRWASFPGLSNESSDATFVDGGGRIIYNVAGRFAGSPYHQYTGSPVTTLGGMHWTMPADDLMLGTSSFNKQHVPGNGPLDDSTIQREQTSFWIARQLGLPWDYRRYYILYVNGNRHGPLMEDSQVPGSDLLAEYFPKDNNGFLFKNNAWFEFDANGQSFDNKAWCTLNKYTTPVNGVRQYKLSRYRWNYWMRQYPDSASNFTNVFALIEAANTPTSSPAYEENLEALMNVEEWMRMSAAEHATGDWDSFTTQNQWNMYSYKPLSGKWTLLKWDWNISLGNSGSWGPDGGNLFTVSSSDSRMSTLMNYPPHMRAYLRAFKDMADGPMNSVNVNPMLDAKYAAFVANGLTVSPYYVASPTTDGLKSWIGTMRKSLLSALSARGVSNLSFTVDNPQTMDVGTNSILLTGIGPLDLQTIAINGTAYPITWTTIKNWSVTVPLYHTTNLLAIQGYDTAGRFLSNMTATISVTDTNPLPILHDTVKINEWMASNKNTAVDPVDGAAHDWFELYNPNPDYVDLSGYYLANNSTNHTQWLAPTGTVIPPFGFLMAWADEGLTNAGPNVAGTIHVNFKLSKSGGFIGLFDAAGRTVDAVTYGTQASDVSQGRWPDGATNLYTMTTPTPGLPNQVGATEGIQVRLLSLPDASVGIQVYGYAGGSYTLQTSADLLSWTNLITTNAVTAPFIFADPNRSDSQRFYRVTSP